jgi:SAM-dependent methyltransferase
MTNRQSKIENQKSAVPPNWWKTFFSRDYCVLYRHEFAPQRSREEAEMVERAVPLQKTDRILDLCCGHARHLQVLQQHGYHVIGLDYSWDQLAVARSRATEFGGDYRLARGDARMAPFGPVFNVVISMNGSFGYFSEEENRGHLAEAARMLRPGGKYLIDQQNPALLRKLPPMREVRDPESGARVIEKFEVDDETHRVRAHKELRLGRQRTEFSFSVRIYELEELLELLREQGLEPHKVFGDYDLASYSAEGARLIIAAEKV